MLFVPYFYICRQRREIFLQRASFFGFLDKAINQRFGRCHNVGSSGMKTAAIIDFAAGKELEVPDFGGKRDRVRRVVSHTYPRAGRSPGSA
jgi:hypothetical protein